MKGIYITSLSIIFLCMVMFPLLSMEDTIIPSVDNQSQTGINDSKSETIRVYITEKKKIENISMKDYVIGVVLAEMPAEYNEEALKAQAVAAYTFALRKKEDMKNEEYDLTDSFKTDQAYLGKEAAKERFGDNYVKYMDKVSSVVDAVYGKKIVYEGKLIFAAYHSISAGKTEDAENIWGEKYPYLIPVESVGDTLSPSYLSSFEIKPEEFISAMKNYDINFTENPSEWLGAKKCSESGTVLTQNICGIEVKGVDIRTALGLKSAVFEVEYSDDKFKFTVRGYGHCVGMSQYGAQFMASQGSKYDEILKWYYPGSEIIN